MHQLYHLAKELGWVASSCFRYRGSSNANSRVSTKPGQPQSCTSLTLILRNVTSPHEGAGEWSVRYKPPASVCSFAAAGTIGTGVQSPTHYGACTKALPSASSFMAATPGPLLSPLGGLAWQGFRPVGLMPTFNHTGRLLSEFVTRV